MKKNFVLVVIIMAAIILGSLVGSTANGVEFLDWLFYSKGFKLDSLNLDLSVININFGCSIRVNVAQILFIITGLAVYPKATKALGL